MAEFSIFCGSLEMRVMHDPRRKKPCLFLRDKDENSFCKVASFNNEYAAEAFVDYLVELLDGHLQKEEENNV